MKTFGDFLSAAKLEKAAGIEAFNDDARLPLDEKLRLGNAAGPLVCASCTKDEATFSQHPSISFDWGKLKPGGSVHPVRPGEVMQLHAKLPKGTLSPDDTPTTLKKGYFRDPDFNLSTGTTYLFEEAHFDGVKQVIEILGACEPADTWPAGLPAQPFLTAPPEAPAEERALAACLDDGNPLFAVKGPPGTGKTDLLAEVALKLAQAGKKVGIITVSHDAVNNALARAAAKLGTGPSALKLQKHGKDDHGIAGVTGGKLGGTELPAIWGGVIAAASQMFKKDGKNLVLSFKHGTCDVLLLDEAGQIPAYEAAALSHLATRMILFGDEDQLPNITKAAHPPGSHGDSSAMQYLREVLGPAWTIPLETSHRMNTGICDLIQRHFYPDIALKAGKNASAHLLENSSPLPPLIQDAFRHKGPRLSRSQEEVTRVVDWVKRLLAMQVVLENKAPRPMTTGDIAILTPFRIQASAITKAIAEAGIPDSDKLRIGTVDKMQGQGAAAVIYSMASSSPDYIANQAEWLFSSNRWNVAISRAHACAIVVGDVEAHLKSVPSALNGIAAQQKIRKVMGDSAWKHATA